MSQDPNPVVDRMIKGGGTTGALTPGQLDELRKLLANPVVTDATSAISAGFKLGIQHALEVIRKNYVR